MKQHPRDKTRKSQNGPWDPGIQNQIKELIKLIDPSEIPFEHSDIISEIMVTALKAVQSQIGRGDLKLLSRSLRELRYAFKIFKPYRHLRKVTIFGSARTPSKDRAYQLAKEFSRKLVQHDYMVITGAGPGIMGAGNEGAGPKSSFGVNIRLPFEQHPNVYIADQPTYIDCRYFFTRKLVFVKEASAAAFFPGGFGTLDEAFELLTLVQTGKCDPIPIVLMDVPGGTYWKSLDRFIDQSLLRTKKISHEDKFIYKITTTVKEACDEIFQFYSTYHSLRYVGDNVVIRLNRPISNKTLDKINKSFKDILVSGAFTKTDPLSEEQNQKDLLHLPRIKFVFNRINNGRLRQLIDVLNKD